MNGVHSVLTHNKRYIALYVVMVVALGLLFVRIPTSFLPDEDAGAMLGSCRRRRVVRVERTEAALALARDYFLTQEKGRGFEGVLSVAGFSSQAWARTWAWCSSS